MEFFEQAQGDERLFVFTAELQGMFDFTSKFGAFGLWEFNGAFDAVEQPS